MNNSTKLLGVLLFGSICVNALLWMDDQTMSGKLRADEEKINKSVAASLPKVSDNETAYQNQLQEQVPVKVQYRRSALGNGFVFRFYNTSYQELFCTIEIRNSSIGKRWRMDLLPGRFKEIGSLEGWQAFPGDSCEVNADGFSPIEVHIPE